MPAAARFPRVLASNQMKGELGFSCNPSPTGLLPRPLLRKNRESGVLSVLLTQSVGSCDDEPRTSPNLIKLPSFRESADHQCCGLRLFARQRVVLRRQLSLPTLASVQGQARRFLQPLVGTAFPSQESKTPVPFLGCGRPNPETTRRGVASAEDADRPCPVRLRVPRLQNQARVQKASFAREQDS